MRGIVKGEVIGEPKPAGNRSLLRTIVDFALGWVISMAVLEALGWCIRQVPGLRHIHLLDISWTVIFTGVVSSLVVAYFVGRDRGLRP